MKTFRFLAMMLVVVLAGAAFTGCSDDDDEVVSATEEFTLAGTSWTYVDRYEEDGIKITETYSLRFTAKTASYSIDYVYTEGNQTTTSSTYTTYTYSFKDDFVVLIPDEAKYAYLEGQLTAQTKMVITNTSSNKVIGTFYKQ